MSTPRILITGSTGQLGSSFREAAHLYPGYDLTYVSRKDLPLDDAQKMRDVFTAVQPDYCINCAAYTAVDRAESEKELAFEINATAAGNMAKLCNELGCHLIHISTDYVFDGTSSIPYREEDKINPVNVYGASKAEGERLVMQFSPDSIIIRTSWVFSEHGRNFVKTMISLMQSREQISVVNDQTGAPTYAYDLAKAVMTIISSSRWLPGIYHYSNSGQTTWFGFAEAIREMIASGCRVNPVPSSAYPTPAQRPRYSLLNTGKIISAYGLQIRDWKESLHECGKRLQPV